MSNIFKKGPEFNTVSQNHVIERHWCSRANVYLAHNTTHTIDGVTYAEIVLSTPPAATTWSFASLPFATDRRSRSSK